MKRSDQQAGKAKKIVFSGQSLAAMEKLGQQLAAILKPGEAVFLSGTLGAGKSTLARALIRAAAKDDTLEVPSPTFPILIPYETDRMVIYHYDLYRLSSEDELEELGLYEDVKGGLTLIEWPEQLGAHSFETWLKITIKEDAGGQSRTLELEGAGQMAEKLTRYELMRGFLKGTAFEQADWSYLQGDASTRSYIRLNHNGETALFMNAPPQPDGPVIKNGKPYSQIAHLAEDMTSFVAISNTLRGAGFKLPEILKHDIDEGLLLISDLGNQQYFHLITQKGADTKALYQPAIDTLAALRGQKPSLMSVDDKTYHLPPFDLEALLIEVELLLDWYWPFVKGVPVSHEARQAYEQIWTNLHKKIDQLDNSHWILRDFHSPNLMRLDGVKSIEKVGIIDFQDAMQGNAAYDVASLCQDARLTIPPSLQEHLLESYISSVQAKETNFDESGFRTSYAIFCAQRACKLLGIFVRLKERDNKPGYLAHLPRIWDYLEQSLPHPELEGLNAWFRQHMPSTCRKANFITPNQKNSEARPS